MEALTREEFQRLLAHTRECDPRLWLMILIHFWHAGRNSEIIHLTRDNFIGDYIEFPRLKGSLPCKQALVSHENPLLNEKLALLEYLPRIGRNQRLFPMSRWTYWRHVVKAALAVGIPRVKAKTTVLKHSICTYLYETVGANMVQRRAGHVNGANTLEYGKVQESQVDPFVSAGVKL